MSRLKPLTCVVFCIACLLTAAVASAAGLAPANRDSFETGDYRNWLPKYTGSSDQFIRPQFSVTDENPISGEYSLRWSGGDPEERHRWRLVSNAFYLAPPLTAQVDFRLAAPLEESGLSIGLALLETERKAATLDVSARWALLASGELAPSATSMRSDAELSTDTVYTLSLRLESDGRLHGRIFETQSGRLVYEADTRTTVHPHALAISIAVPGGSEAEVTFDNVRVDAAPYRVQERTWTRAPLPYYVALPRQNDVSQAEGNWVGGHGLFKDDDGYHMWYRIRNNEVRGDGYGYAFSEDGLIWQKHDDNPLFTIDRDLYSSNENIAVRKIDGEHRAWYTVDLIDEPGWRTVHARSDDGIAWEHDGIVIDNPPNKDADVVYVDGTYYLYAIGPDNTSFSVYTSDDGLAWEMRNVIPLKIHRHPTIYFDPETNKFWLYAFGSRRGVHRAWSSDGIEFSDFEYVWSEPPVGIDDWREGGIDYAQFRTDPHGHLLDSHRNLIMIYQGRNNKANNHPSWLYHGSERILMAGYFSGLHVDVPTHVAPDQPLRYERFPYDATPAEGLSAQSSSPGRVTVTRWTPDEDVVAEFRMRGNVGDRWRFELQGVLEPGETYELVDERGVPTGNGFERDGPHVFERHDAGAFGDDVFVIHLLKDYDHPLILRRAQD